MSLSLNEDSQTSSEQLQAAFTIVTRGLTSLGLLPISKLADLPKADIEGFDIPFLAPQLERQPTASSSNLNNISTTADPQPITSLYKKNPSALTMQYVAQLHQTCQEAFGNSEALRFEFLEENGPNSKQCVLTITRPNGARRSYTSKPEFSRKSDAKAYVAAVAVEMGAVDFIIYGNRDSQGKGKQKQLILAPLDAKPTKKSEEKKEDSINLESLDEYSKQIAETCLEWRAGRVKPQWIHYVDWRNNNLMGCALRISLSEHSEKIYSTDVAFESHVEAQKDCSRDAIEKFVLEYIKFGNGQTEPAPKQLAESTDLEQQLQQQEETARPPVPAKGITLQTFFDALPKPLPEHLPDKPANEMNAVGWLNTTLQQARGAKLSTQFHYFSDGKGKHSLHGCILRLLTPQEVKTYIADKVFSKRNDAKGAVCFQAMSQGIGQYIRDIAKAMESKVTLDMRIKMNQKMLPIIMSEMSKLKQGTQPNFEYELDKNAFGCTLIISLSAEPRPEEVRKWTVPTEYRTKNDARVAVVSHALEDGVLEFIRFRGEAPPPDYDPETFRNGGNRDRNDSAKSKGKTKEQAEKKDVPMGPGDDTVEMQMEETISAEEKKKNDDRKQSSSGRRDEEKGKRKGKNKQDQADGRAQPSPSDPNLSRVSAAASAVIERLTRSAEGNQQRQTAQGPSTQAIMGGVWQPLPVVSRPPPQPSHSPTQYWQHPPPAPMITPSPYQNVAGHSSALNIPGTPMPHNPQQSPHHTLATFPPYPVYLPHPSPALLLQQTNNPAHYSPVDLKQSNHLNPGATALEDTTHAKIQTAETSIKTEGDDPQIKRPRSTEEDRQLPSKRQRTDSGAQIPRSSLSISTKEEKESVEDIVLPHMKELHDFCASEGHAPPTCGHSVIQEDGKTMYKIWIIVGKERLELPKSFSSLVAGRERLAKQVLNRLKTQSKK